MRVVLEALSARVGGGPTYLRNLLVHDAPPGVEVIVIAPANLELPELGRGVRRHHVAASLQRPALRLPWLRLRLPSVVEALAADVLFAPGGLLLGGLPRTCRTVTMFRNMIPFDPDQLDRAGWTRRGARLRLLRRLMKTSMRRADLVIFVSRFGRDVVARHGVETRRSTVIPHGVGSLFRVAVGAPAWAPPEGYFVYVSALEAHKAQREVVEAFARARRAGLQEKLLLVGADRSHYAAEVRRTIGRLGLENEVIITGALPNADLPAVYQGATAIVFASEVENCPNTLLEGMASGRPVLASRRPAMVEFGGDTLDYFEPRDPDELAGRMLAVSSDEAHAEQRANAARDRSQAFDWARVAEETWRAICDVTSV